MKVCTKCKIQKDESEFHRARNRKDGFYPYCKICKSNDDKAYRQKPGYKERKNANERGRRKRNPEKVREYCRIRAKYDWHNNPKAKQRDVRWKKNNKQRISEYCKKNATLINDVYAKGALRHCGYKANEIEKVPALIEIKKIQIITHRINKLKKQKT